MVDDHRYIPGLASVAGRAFLYLESEDPTEFHRRFREIGDHIEQQGPPPERGMITENATLVTPTDRCFCGISFKGDLRGWEQAILRFAAQAGVATDRIEGDVLRASDGSVWALKECRVDTYQVPRSRQANPE